MNALAQLFCLTVCHGHIHQPYKTTTSENSKQSIANTMVKCLEYPDDPTNTLWVQKAYFTSL